MPTALIAVVVAAVFISLGTYHLLMRRFTDDDQERALFKKKEKKDKKKLLKKEGDSRLEAVKGRLIELFNNIRPMSRMEIKKTTERLWRAGIRMDARAFHAFSMGFTVVFCIFAAGLFIDGLIHNVVDSYVFGVVCALAGLAVPNLLLNLLIKNRQAQIEVELPTVLEMLSSAVSAGTTLDQGFRFVAEKTDGPLALEFAQVDREIRILGMKRDVALQAMARRCDVQSVSVFVSAVIQAQNQGASMSTVLKSQARRVREQYYSMVEEKANKVPTKMVIPLAMFILPTLFIIVLAPIVSQIAEFMLGG